MKESRWVGKMRGQVPRYSLNLEGAGEGDLYDDLLSATQAFMVLPREYTKDFQYLQTRSRWYHRGAIQPVLLELMDDLFRIDYNLIGF